VNRHYQYRDPIQMQQRIDDRYGVFPHITAPRWQDYVEPASTLRSLDADGRIHLDRHRCVVERVRQRLRARGGDAGGVSHTASP
jgi:hypothetical protein